MKNNTIDFLIIEGTNRLKNKQIDTARLDSQLLLGHVLNKNKLYLIMNNEEVVSDEKVNEYFSLIEKREAKMPIKYILKQCEFMGMDFYVEEGVLIPRPDTEILVEEVLKNIAPNDEKNICDLCCGSGAIGISIASLRQNTKVDLIDYYDIPEKVTLINIEKNNLQDRTRFIKSDLLNEIISLGLKYDILVSNPPYIEADEIANLMDDVKEYEPHTALDGGKDGLIFYRKIVDQSIDILNKNGILAFEIGYNQGEAVKTLMEQKEFKEVKVIKDLAGLDRVVIGQLID